jgi:dienelactone hydrolase
VNAFFCKWLDSWVIRTAAARMPPPIGCDPELAAAQAMLDQPDFFRPDVKLPQLELHAGDRFVFQSAIKTPFSKNNTVHGRFSRCGADWQSKPTVILLHGWNDEINYRLRFPMLLRYFNRLGINTAIIALPYHFERRPFAPAPVRNFISEHILRTVEATQQSLADIRAFARWLNAQGCEQVSLWGISLGAWLAGLTICYDDSFHSAVLVTPVARMDRMIGETAFVAPIRNALKRGNMNLSVFNLDEHQPLIPKENILIVEAKYDRFVPAETVETLWQAWDGPEIWRRDCGHVTVMVSLGLSRLTARWLQSHSFIVPASAGQQ